MRVKGSDQSNMNIMRFPLRSLACLKLFACTLKQTKAKQSKIQRIVNVLRPSTCKGLAGQLGLGASVEFFKSSKTRVCLARGSKFGHGALLTHCCRGDTRLARGSKLTLFSQRGFAKTVNGYHPSNTLHI